MSDEPKKRMGRPPKNKFEAGRQQTIYGSNATIDTMRCLAEVNETSLSIEYENAAKKYIAGAGTVEM